MILESLTDIELVSEFKCNPVTNREATVETILSTRNACIRECASMFESGLYEVYINQFGPNCKDLPKEARTSLEIARREVNQ